MVAAGRAGPLTGAPAEELEALLRLRLLPRIGDLAAARLVGQLGSARAALEAPDAVLREVAGPAAVRARRTQADRAQREARATLRRAQELGVRVTGRGLPGYPSVLLRLADPPPVLFLSGREELLDVERVAVVGTRDATGAGRRFAERLGRTLSGAGIPVVSGLALGIDAAAHRGALEGRGSTIAVLGSGLARTHPRSNRRLQERIAREGLLVSEFRPDEGAAPHHFPRRNRILAALARAVVVVEAGVRSGALITVDHALDLGIDVFAVPGSVEYEQSRGTNGLLYDGAEFLAHPEQLLEWWDERVPGAEARASQPRDETARPADARTRDVCSVLDARPRSVDELARTLGAPAARVLRELTELELQGLALQEPDGWRAVGSDDRVRPRARDFSGLGDGSRR